MMRNVFIFTVLVICSLSVLSCKDDNDEYPKKVYPTEVKEYVLEDALGDLCYDEELEKWIIVPDGDSFFVGDENGCYFIIPEMDEQYKELEGKVVFSGKVVLSYYVESGDVFGSTVFYYSIHLDSLSSSSVFANKM